MSLASSLSPNLFIGEAAWNQQLTIEPSLDDSEEYCRLRESAEILLFENENAILTKFVNAEEVVATDRIAVLKPIRDASEDCQNCSTLESDIRKIQGQRERENNALMDKIIDCETSLSAAVAANNSERQAWEQRQQQLLEKMERESQAREQRQQQLLEKMERESQAREQIQETVKELRSDVDALVKFSDIYVLNMAAEIMKRFLKKQSNVGAPWLPSNIFEEREKAIVRTSIREFGVTYEVERFAELSAQLLNARNSAIHFAEVGDNLPSLAQEVVQVLESLSRTRSLNPTMAFALNVLQMSGGLLSPV